MKKKITREGVYRGLSYDEYNSINALRSTYLKKHLHCPANCLEPDEETAALRFGIISHVFTLEGKKKFDSLYYVMPEIPEPVNFMGKRWKQTTDYQNEKKRHEAMALSAGKELVSQEDYDTIVGIDKNLRLHPTAKLLLAKKEAETVFVWADPETKALCKARLDLSPYQGMDVIADYKSCEDASENGFRRAINNYGYGFSAAFYLWGVSIAMKRDDLLFMWLAGEKSKPYRVEVHEFNNEKGLVDRSMGQVHEALRAEARCKKNKFYEPYLNAGVIVQA